MALPNHFAGIAIVLHKAIKNHYYPKFRTWLYRLKANIRQQICFGFFFRSWCKSNITRQQKLRWSVCIFILCKTLLGRGVKHDFFSLSLLLLTSRWRVSLYAIYALVHFRIILCTRRILVGFFFALYRVYTIAFTTNSSERLLLYYY